MRNLLRKLREKKRDPLFYRNASVDPKEVTLLAGAACHNTGSQEMVRIGKGSVVALGAIVTKDVPPYTVVAGNPARVVKHLTPPEEESA